MATRKKRAALPSRPPRKMVNDLPPSHETGAQMWLPSGAGCPRCSRPVQILVTRSSCSFIAATCKACFWSIADSKPSKP